MTETRTNEVRQVITGRLNEIRTRYNIAEISYKNATDDQMFPHIVYDLTNIIPTDQGREDYTVDVHIWTRDDHAAWEIGDAVADIFAYWNAPQLDILPTFYEANVFQVADTDHEVAHVVVRIQAQNYERNGRFQWQT